MTGQEPDRFYYKDKKLELVGLKGKLPIPSDYGIETHMTATSCRRGYIMRYKIVENHLFLDGFWFNTKSDDLPEINGVKPIKLSEETAKEGDYMHTMFTYEYRDLNLSLQFNGKILLAKDLIRSKYVHMGFQSPKAYKTVLEFDFKDGIIVDVEEKSEAAKKAMKKERKPKSMNPRDIEDWIIKRLS
ncbi:MAG: hypothetical protein ACFE8V_11995 [Promethearchaeota archaeon]